MHFDKATSSDYHVIEITSSGSPILYANMTSISKSSKYFLLYIIEPLDLNLDNLLTVCAKITTDNIQGCQPQISFFIFCLHS